MFLAGLIKYYLNFKHSTIVRSGKQLLYFYLWVIFSKVATKTLASA